MNERLKSVRLALGLSMEKFAAPLGVGKTAISRIESGENRVTDRMIKSICAQYRVSEEWFRSGNGSMFLPDPDEEIAAWVEQCMADRPETFKRRFVSMLKRLSDDDWDRLEEMARMLYEGDFLARDENRLEREKAAAKASLDLDEGERGESEASV